MEPNILSLDLPSLEERLGEMGYPRFRASQVFHWIHARGVFCAEEMKNLPQALRRDLTPLVFPLPVQLDDDVQGGDGTQKFRFRLPDGGMIESVWMPGKGHSTLCVSTQLGCRMGCLFCRTGKLGWKRNLEVGEILGQLYAVREMFAGVRERVTHVVLMGMGEPLDNLDHTLCTLRILSHPMGAGLSTRRITVSTVGIPEGLESLQREVPVNITVSLNAADEDTRSLLMPINRVHSLDGLCRTLRGLPLAPRRRITIAYVLVKGINDRPEDARRLGRLLHGIRCKVNLIPFNPFPGSELERPEEPVMLAFQESLRTRGISTYIRRSKGGDILAACGQLAGSRPQDESGGTN